MMYMNIHGNERTTFENTGILNLKNIISKNKTSLVKELILQDLTRLRLRENGKWHMKKFAGISPFQVTNKISQAIKHHPQFDQLVSAEILSCIDDLATSNFSKSSTRPQILITPPQKEKWSLPEHGWHVDIARPSVGVLPGIQIFVLLDDIDPCGGATLAIAGSHINPNILPTPDHVIEMIGKAGDIYLMDMRIRHAPSINASNRARMVLTIRFLRN